MLGSPASRSPRPLDRRWPLFVLLVVGAAVSVAPSGAEGAEPVRFARDILPILSDHCFHCHGQDEKTRAAGLRLDTAAGALRETDRVIVPGQSAASELLRRIVSADPAEMMPPPSAKRRPTAAQVTLVRRWIDEGAPWGKHWAFERIERPALPIVRDRGWPKQPLDHFVLRELEARNWLPSSEASPETVVGGVLLDLL